VPRVSSLLNEDYFVITSGIVRIKCDGVCNTGGDKHYENGK
jgi:hypothetical protein